MWSRLAPYIYVGRAGARETQTESLECRLAAREATAPRSNTALFTQKRGADPEPDVARWVMTLLCIV